MPDLRPGRLAAAVDLKDALSGLALAGVGVWFAVTALRRLSLGSANAMGPGYFPLMVAIGLTLLGLAIALKAIGRATPEDRYVGPRALACILAAPLVFAFGVAPLGFVPAVALTGFVASYGSTKMRLGFALALTAGLTALSTLVFVQLLQMPVQLFGPLLGF